MDTFGFAASSAEKPRLREKPTPFSPNALAGGDKAPGACRSPRFWLYQIANCHIVPWNGFHTDGPVPYGREGIEMHRIDVDNSQPVGSVMLEHIAEPPSQHATIKWVVYEAQRGVPWRELGGIARNNFDIGAASQPPPGLRSNFRIELNSHDAVSYSARQPPIDDPSGRASYIDQHVVRLDWDIPHDGREVFIIQTLDNGDAAIRIASGLVDERATSKTKIDQRSTCSPVLSARFLHSILPIEPVQKPARL